MTAAGIAAYLGGALGYELAGTALLALLARCLVGRWPGTAQAALAAALIFVLALGLHPFPDPATLDCRGGGKELLLKPFDYLQYYRGYWESGRSVAQWLRSPAIMSPVMNVVLFMPVGLALGALTRSWWGALACAAGLTLFIELSQISALYGLYPCRYRHFDIDDLTHNMAGVLIGFAAMRHMALRRDRTHTP